MKRLTLTCLALFSLVIVSGCYHNRAYSSHTYKERNVGQVAHTYKAVIVSSRQVVIRAEGGIDNNAVGTITGAAAGAAIGSQIGRGRGRGAAIAGGAILGGLAGHEIEREAKTEYGMEYTVRILRTGELVTVVQGNDYHFRPGERVLFIENHRGRSRIAPDYGN